MVETVRPLNRASQREVAREEDIGAIEPHEQEPIDEPLRQDSPSRLLVTALSSTGARLIYDGRCSRTRFRFVRNPLFCLGSIIPIIGEKTFIQPDTWIWTRRVNLVPPLDGST